MEVGESSHTRVVAQGLTPHCGHLVTVFFASTILEFFRGCISMTVPCTDSVIRMNTTETMLMSDNAWKWDPFEYNWLG